MNEIDVLFAEAFDEGVVTEVIRPSAILPEVAARSVLSEMSERDVLREGHWHTTPILWRRYDRPFDGHDGTQGRAELLGEMHVAYGTPTRYDITIYRATITRLGTAQGWTVERLCDEALGFGGYTLADCPRAELAPPPKPFRLDA